MENTTNNAIAIKTAITGLIGFLTSLWGWWGWLALAWIACIGIDYFTGYIAALKNGEWSSEVAREGIWHKFGCAITVMVSIIMDLLFGYVFGHIAVIDIPFTYKMFLSTLVLIWYILMELGSITENIGRMGAPVPPFIARSIAILKTRLDAATDSMLDDEDGDAVHDNR